VISLIKHYIVLMDLGAVNSYFHRCQVQRGHEGEGRSVRNNFSKLKKLKIVSKMKI